MSATEALLDEAIAAATAGNHRNALALLARVVELDTRNERAWLWLAELVETDTQRIDCLERVLSINPDNSHAHQRLEILKLKAPTPATPPHTPRRSPEGPILPLPQRIVTGQSPAPSPQPSAGRQPALTAQPNSTHLEPPGRSRWAIIGCLAPLLAVFAVIWLCGSLPSGDDSTPSTPSGDDSTPSTTFMVGDAAVLHSDQGQPLLVAVDKDTLDAAIDAAIAGDDYAGAELVLTGRLFSVDSGTRVLVIDLALFATKVRILEGPYAGTPGWVVDEALRPE